jgi:hypothetical protein
LAYNKRQRERYAALKHLPTKMDTQSEKGRQNYGTDGSVIIKLNELESKTMLLFTGKDGNRPVIVSSFIE